MSPHELGALTFSNHIAKNPYPGRGLVIGKSASGDTWQQVYWIMGRSANSRNRRFTLTGSTLRTEPYDPSKVEDPSLIIYEAMLELPGMFLVSNGDQTRTLHDGLSRGSDMKSALASREREPDAPNYTPRITGMLDFSTGAPELALSILKANKIDPAFSDRHYFFPHEPAAGIGYGLTTYMGDGNPLPTFASEPLILPLQSTAEETLDTYWTGLNSENRISIAVKEISIVGKSVRTIMENRFDG